MGNVTQGETVLEASGLAVAYGKKQVLFGLDLTVQRGERVALLGLNGAGKSTALKAIAGLLPLLEGRVQLNGQDVSTWSIPRRLRAGLMCPYMLQGGLAFDSLSVGENLALAGQHLPRSHRRARTDLVLAALPLLTGLLKRRAGLLSGGERHALAAAMTLLAAERPHVLLLDEPTAGLSSEAAGALLEGLRHLAQQAHTAVVLVEQNLEVALENADRAVLLRNGRAIESVSTTDTTLAEVTQRLLET